MDRINPEIQDLIERARQDAGLSVDVHVVVLDAAHDPERGQAVVYFPVEAEVQGNEAPMTEEDANELRRAPVAHRIAVVGRTETPELLGLLRYAMELARQYEAFPAVWQFAWAVVDVGVSEAHGGRRGSGVMHNVLPQVRDANIAAERLVTRVLGPQVGNFYGPWGVLFRQQRDFGGDATLPARAVILAAIYRPWLDRRMGGPDRTAGFVADAHPDAEDWWQRLTDDPTIGHVTGVIGLLAPTDAEIAEAAAVQVAWRPLAHLIDRAIEHGLRILADGR